MSVISYSQYGEDLVLWRALRHVSKGFYVDVCAMLPVAHSVTKLFYEAGWSGVNIDPVRSYIEAFDEDRPRDVNLNTAVGPTSGKSTFYEVVGTGLSTHVKEYADRYASLGETVRSYSVPTVTLDSVLDRHAPGTVHFLKIDTEGAERAVLESVNLRRHRPWIIAVEATIPCTFTPSYEEWEPLLLDQGYVFGHSHVINRFYVAAEMKHLAECWSQPVDDYRRYADIAEIEKLNVEIARLNGESAKLSERVAALDPAPAPTPSPPRKWLRRPVWNRG